MVALDKRMGGFKDNVDPKIEKFMDEARGAIEMMPPVLLEMPWHKISPALSPSYRAMVANLNGFATFVRVRKYSKYFISGAFQLI